MARRWVKIGSGIAGSIASLIGFFLLLQTQFGFVFEDITGDFACVGTYEHPCLSQFTVRNPTSYDVDVYSKDQVKLDFSPEIKDWALFVPDGRCRATGKCACEMKNGERLGYPGWRCVDFTNKTKPRVDKAYNFRFGRYSTTTFLLAGVKHSRFDKVKWTFGTEKGELDPLWDGTISFVSPTPANASIRSELNIPVNISITIGGGEEEGTGEEDHYAFTDFGNDLVLWLTMDDGNSSRDPTDLSTYSNNATLVNDAGIKAGGKWGNYTLLDGVGDEIVVQDDVSLEAANELTVSAWIKTNISEVRYVMHKINTGSPYQGFALGTNTLGSSNLYDNNEIAFWDGTGWSSYDLDIIGLNINDDQWHHLLVSHNGTDACFYWDGVQRDCDSSALGSQTNSINLRIGHQAFTGNFFNGSIDDVLIFNRSLEPTEVSSLYNASATPYDYTFDGLTDFETYSFRGHGVDLEGEYGSTELRFVTINTSADFDAPSVSIVIPQAGNYTSVRTEINYTVSDQNLESCWYSLDNGATNTSNTCGSNVSGLNSGQGSSTWTVYANDSSNNIGSANVTFFVDSLPPTITINVPENITYNNATDFPLDFNVTTGESCQTVEYQILTDGICPLDDMGPLRQSTVNDNYFINPAGEPVFLSGSSIRFVINDIWNVTLNDSNYRYFNMTEAITFYNSHNHNFIRTWNQAWHTRFNFTEGFPWLGMRYTTPHMFNRTCPSGTAADGLTPFNLSQFNQSWFDRLDDRVEQFEAEGIYVSIMLFEGYIPQFANQTWEHSMFNDTNNCNNIGAVDTNGNGRDYEVHQLVNDNVTAFQKAYIEKIVDTLNDNPNVLYEIANEAGQSSKNWQYTMINHLRDYQNNKTYQHPIGMTYAYNGGTNQQLFDSNATWFSPGGLNPVYSVDTVRYATDKVFLYDTDHYDGCGNVGVDDAWKSITRGHGGFIYLDQYYDDFPFLTTCNDNSTRQSMGQILDFAAKADLLNMTPLNTTDECSSGYCLVRTNRSQWIGFTADNNANITMNLTSGNYSYQWIDINANNLTSESGTITDWTGGMYSVNRTFSGDAAVFVNRTSHGQTYSTDAEGDRICPFIPMSSTDNLNWNATNASIPVGSYMFNVTATDQYGNTNSTIEWFSVLNFSADSAPEISFVSPTPANGSTQTGDSIFVNVSSSDSNSDHYAFTDFNSDLRFWMRMDDVNSSGDPTDLSSYSNNGSLNGDALINETAYWGNATHLDGILDYVNIAHDDSLNFDSGSFTASLWIRFATAATGQRFFFAKKSGTAASGAGWMIYHQSDGDLTLMMADGTTRLWTRDNVGATIDDGNWHHVVFVLDARDGIREYVDGVAQSPSVNEGPLSSVGSVNNTQVLRIGSRSDGGTMFNGTIDDVLLFNRNLSAGEVSALYNSTATQYQNNFTDLADGTYTFTGYAVDKAGNKNQTEDREVTISSDVDTTKPTLNFTDPTPANGSTQSNTDIFVNISSSDVDNSANTIDHYTLADFDNDLLFWMRMDDVNGSGDPTDLSSHSHNGTLYGAAVINQTGYWGNGSTYDGHQDAIQMGADNSDLIISDGANYTISAWLNMRETSKAQGVFGGMSSSSRNNFAYSIYVNSGHIRCTIGNSTSHDNKIIVSSASANTWYHIACSWNGTTHVVYSNGVQVGTEVPSLTGTLPKRGAVGTIRNLIGIEYNPVNANTGFNGTIDEVMAFNRTLDATEIAALYNATATQYQHNFTGLSQTTHTFTGHAVDRYGNRNMTENRVVTISSDSCTYTSGDWNIDAADNCVVSSDVVIDGSNVYCTGTGTFTIQNNADVTNWTYRRFDRSCYYQSFGNAGFK